MSTDSFREFALEQLAALDGLYCKHLFGRHSLYLGRVFFGILFDDRPDFTTHPNTLPDGLTAQAPRSPPWKSQF